MSSLSQRFLMFVRPSCTRVTPTPALGTGTERPVFTRRSCRSLNSTQVSRGFLPFFSHSLTRSLLSAFPPIPSPISAFSHSLSRSLSSLALVSLHTVSPMVYIIFSHSCRLCLHSCCFLAYLDVQEGDVPWTWCCYCCRVVQIPMSKILRVTLLFTGLHCSVFHSTPTPLPADAIPCRQDSSFPSHKLPRFSLYLLQGRLDEPGKYVFHLVHGRQLSLCGGYCWGYPASQSVPL